MLHAWCMLDGSRLIAHSSLSCAMSLEPWTMSNEPLGMHQARICSAMMLSGYQAINHEVPTIDNRLINEWMNEWMNELIHSLINSWLDFHLFEVCCGSGLCFYEAFTFLLIPEVGLSEMSDTHFDAHNPPFCSNSPPSQHPSTPFVTSRPPKVSAFLNVWNLSEWFAFFCNGH